MSGLRYANALGLTALLWLAGCGEGTSPLDASAADASPPVDRGPPTPATLSATGLFERGASGPYADGVLSYSVRYPLWTDDAEKRRHLRLPAGARIDTSDPDRWVFPVGARLFKEFLVDGVPVETRLLWKTGAADWRYVAYRYRADGSDADPVPDGAEDVRSTTHDVPSTDDCRNCHRGAGDFVLGVGGMQLDRTTFDDWIERGVLPADTAWGSAPGDGAQARALGYLHGNCGHCHGPIHPLAAHRSLRLHLPVGVTDPASAPAWVTAAGVPATHELQGTTHLLVPGDPDASQLYVRMGLRGQLGMPPVGTERLDVDGRATVRAWISAEAP